MNIEEALFSRLSGHAGLSALVGSRIYPTRMPQGGALPAVTYRRTGSTRVRAMGADPGLARPRFQVSAWAAGFEEARDVAAQVRAALQRWRGTESGVVIQDTFLESDADSFEPDTERHQVALDIEIIHEE